MGNKSSKDGNDFQELKDVNLSIKDVVKTFGDGSKYIGDWKDGNAHGKGTYFDINNERYEGEFKDGESHGKGIQYYSNGDTFQGEWKNGEASGQGVYIRDGVKYTCFYRSGYLVSYTITK